MGGNLILGNNLAKCAQISKFPIGDKGHTHALYQTITEHPHKHELVQLTQR